MIAAPKTEPHFDADAVRAQFLILSREIDGRPLVYLDSAASAQKPRAVLDAMSHAAEFAYANVHRGLHTLSNEATGAFEDARGKVAGFLNAGHADHVVFTSGATDAINLVAQAWAAPNLGEGDEIILTVMEHHSNIVPWHFLRERQGVRLVWIPPTAEGGFDLSAYEAALSERTKLVAVTHMSNVLGCVTPAAEIARLAHGVGAAVLFDGCQSAVHLDVDVQAIDADFYAISPHKIYAPTGVGALYVHPRRFSEMRPYRGGGEMISEVATDRVTYADPPHMFEAGTPPILEAIGLGAAIDWLASFDRAAIRAHEAALLDQMEGALNDRPWVTIHGRDPSKAALTAFEVADAHPHDIAQILDRFGVAVRAGHHCAQPLHAHLNSKASLRASFGLYNTRDDVNAFIAALDKARAFFA